jgi:predicted ATPase/DNA-binding XRE family transcriptional regulator
MDTELLPACGMLLRRYRRAAGLTQEELAERAGVSVRSIRDLERGMLHAPRRDTIRFLATALELSGQEHAAFTGAARQLGISPLSTSPVGASQAGPFPDGLAAPPFVGRERELALLERHMTGDGPPLFFLAGEPGMGKTRLLRAAIPHAVGAGWRVLEGGCQLRGEREPYAPLLGALQRHIRSQRPAELRADLKGCAWLVRLLPELADGPIPPLPTWTLTPEQERRLMAEAVIRFLSNVAGPSGTLLVLDDLQRASPDALDLLALLVRSATGIPLRVIGAYRDTEVQPPEPLFTLLADLAAAELAARRALRPLAQQEAAQLLDLLLEGTGAEGGTRREEVLQRAGGVPFFLVSCAQGLHLEEGSEEAVPWDVAQSVRKRVAALPPAAREVLGTAALVGRTVPRALLVGASPFRIHDS